MNSLPRFLRIRQQFPPSVPIDVPQTIAAGFAGLRRRIKPGARIAVGVGSRGIANLPEIVTSVIAELRRAGAEPFIFPAMGSHGGATEAGQCEVLASYGITPEAVGVQFRASLEVRQVGTSSEGAPVFCSSEALSADGILLVNRIKPHTDFSGNLGSGLLKMAVIGLGKHAGATVMHAAATQFGHERVIRGMARVLLSAAPMLGAVAILENQLHETARIEVLSGGDFEEAENRLFLESRGLMPLLPFQEIDLLIVDRIGKNISGVGMDPNVIGRSVHGYSSALLRGADQFTPFIRRIFVRDLTKETHGNAIGIGLADFTTTRLIEAMDRRITYINSLTALTPLTAKLPLYFDSDREALETSLTSAVLADPRAARVVRIADTLSVAEMEVSEPLWDAAKKQPGLTAIREARELIFDSEGNLV